MEKTYLYLMIFGIFILIALIFYLIWYFFFRETEEEKKKREAREAEAERKRIEEENAGATGNKFIPYSGSFDSLVGSTVLIRTIDTYFKIDDFCKINEYELPVSTDTKNILLSDKLKWKISSQNNVFGEKNYIFTSVQYPEYTLSYSINDKGELFTAGIQKSKLKELKRGNLFDIREKTTGNYTMQIQPNDNSFHLETQIKYLTNEKYRYTRCSMLTNLYHEGDYDYENDVTFEFMKL